jgi:replicative DNA helicase Mcm
MSSTTSSLAEGWDDYFDDVAAPEVRALAEAYPDRRSLYVDLIDLHDYDADLLEELFADPDRVLSAGAEALRDRSDAFGRVHVRVRNNPQLLAASGVRARHLQELVSVEGVVESIDAPGMRARRVVYECPACGETLAAAPRGLELADPNRCDGCGWGGPFEFCRDRSAFVDLQELRLVDPPDERDGDDHRGVDVLLGDDLVGSVAADDRRVVTGVVRARGDAGRNRFTPYLDAVAVGQARATGGADDEAISDVLESRWQETGGD